MSNNSTPGCLVKGGFPLDDEEVVRLRALVEEMRAKDQDFLERSLAVLPLLEGLSVDEMYTLLDEQGLLDHCSPYEDDIESDDDAEESWCTSLE